MFCFCTTEIFSQNVPILVALASCFLFLLHTGGRNVGLTYQYDFYTKAGNFVSTRLVLKTQLLRVVHYDIYYAQQNYRIST